MSGGMDDDSSKFGGAVSVDDTCSVCGHRLHCASSCTGTVMQQGKMRHCLCAVNHAPAAPPSLPPDAAQPPTPVVLSAEALGAQLPRVLCSVCDHEPHRAGACSAKARASGVGIAWHQSAVRDGMCPCIVDHTFLGDKVQVQPTGRKDDAGKSRWDLMPWSALEHVARVLTLGAQHYADDNWKIVKGARKRYFAAAQRHLLAWYGGEKNAAKWGTPHLAHAICCLLFLSWLDDNGGEQVAVKDPE